MSSDLDDCSSVLALVRAAGLPGYSQGDEPAGREEGAVQPPPIPVVASAPCDGLAATLELVSSAGLPGYDREQCAAAAIAARKAERAVSAPPKPATGQGAPSPKADAPQTANGATRMSVSAFAVLDIAANGGAALAAFEQKMGRPFAAAYRNGQQWYEAPGADGGTRRAFGVMPGAQQNDVERITGDLGSSDLRLSLTTIDLNVFVPAGDAAGAVKAKGPPQLPLDLPKAVRLALGGV